MIIRRISMEYKKITCSYCGAIHEVDHKVKKCFKCGHRLIDADKKEDGGKK
jgi:transposase